MLKCNSKNPKFKNITIGKDFEGTLDGDFAEVVNDSGVKTRYHKKYFSEVAPTLPFAPPPPPGEGTSTITSTSSSFSSGQGP